MIFGVSILIEDPLLMEIMKGLSAFLKIFRVFTTPCGSLYVHKYFDIGLTTRHLDVGIFMI